MKKLFWGLILLLPLTLMAGESGIAQFSPPRTGFYIGGNFGGIWSKFRGSIADAPYFDHNGVFFPSFPQAYNSSENSFTGGAQLGSLYQICNFIFGTEVSIFGMNLKDRRILRAEEVQDFIDIFKPGDSFSSRITWQASWVARLGAKVQNFAVYGLGGVAITKPKISTNITGIVIDGDFFPPDQGSSRQTLLGGTVGVGAEYAAWSNFRIGLEYRYTDFGRYRSNVGQDPVSTLPTGFIYTTLEANKKLLTNAILFRVNYYFC